MSYQDDFTIVFSKGSDSSDVTLVVRDNEGYNQIVTPRRLTGAEVDKVMRAIDDAIGSHLHGFVARKVAATISAKRKQLEAVEARAAKLREEIGNG